MAAANVVLVDELLRVFADVVPAQEARLVGELRLEIPFQHQVVLQGIIQHQAVLVPVLGDVGHTQHVPLADGHFRDVLATHSDLAGDQRLQAGEAVDKLRLTVAVDAGDADDLAPAHLQAHVLHGIVFMYLAGHGHVLHVQHHLAGLAGLLLHVEAAVAAHHHGGQLLHAGVLRLHRADALALTQHGAAVGHGHDLVELVGDEQDGLPLGGQVLHDGHQLVDLLGCQHGGGLIEDEDLVVAVQHLQYLGALLHTHGDVLDQRVRVDLQSVLFAEGQHLLPGLLLLQETVFRGLNAHDDVVQHGEAFHQLEMLVDHADAQGIGIVGVFDRDHRAVLFDDALLGLIQAEQYAHQRGLARAVFAQQGVDLTLL